MTPSTKMMAANFEIYETFLQGADKEVSQFAIGWHVDNDGGLHIDSRTTFVPGGSWASRPVPRSSPGRSIDVSAGRTVHVRLRWSDAERLLAGNVEHVG